eukprot:670296-Rhodomonas_salina.4
MLLTHRAETATHARCLFVLFASILCVGSYGRASRQARSSASFQGLRDPGLKATLRVQPLHETASSMSEETVDRPLDRALASIDDWVGSDRQPDETGHLPICPSAHSS